MGSNPTSDMFTFLKLHLFVFVFVVVIVFVVVVVLLKSGKIVRRIKESKKTSFVVTQAKRSSLNFRFTRTYGILLIRAILNTMFTLSLLCQDGRAV